MEEEKPECDHCWHNTGQVLTSNPPQVEQICCHCGEYQYLWMQYEPSDTDGHGKHHPDKSKI